MLPHLSLTATPDDVYAQAARANSATSDSVTISNHLDWPEERVVDESNPKSTVEMWKQQLTSISTQ